MTIFLALIFSFVSWASTVDRQFVQKFIRKKNSDIVACRKNAAGDAAIDAGHIMFEWTIVPSGNVRDVQVKESTFEDKSLENCLAHCVSAWKFTQPLPLGSYSSKGTVLKEDIFVVYSFQFEEESSGTE